MLLAEWSKLLYDERIEFEDSLTPSEVQALIADQDLRVLQCLGPVNPQTWGLLNDEFFTRRPDVHLRVYGFPGRVCDLAFVIATTVGRTPASAIQVQMSNLPLCQRRLLTCTWSQAAHVAGVRSARVDVVSGSSMAPAPDIAQPHPPDRSARGRPAAGPAPVRYPAGGVSCSR